MTEPSDQRDSGTEPGNLIDLVVECLSRYEREGMAGVDEVCGRNPALADQIRRRVAVTVDAGLLEPPEAGTIEVGSVVGNYRIEVKLGGGGMGVVYRARDEKLGRDVALKMIRPDVLAFGIGRERFFREARIASKLNHPGLCTIYELGDHEGIPYMAMELIDGVTLSRRVRSEVVTEDTFVALETQRVTHPAPGHVQRETSTPGGELLKTTLRLVESALRALHAGHEAGLVHRDLKPANIMVTRDERAVILDFGLAYDESSQDATLTQEGDLLGTPHYMSPEQLTRGAVLDRRTDVYSMGVTLYECVTGRCPFAAPTRQRLFNEIVTGAPESPRGRNAAVSRDLAVVILTAMDRDRDRRYSTAEAFADDIGRVLRREPIHARPAGPVLRLRRWAQRHPVAASLTTAVLLGAVVFMALLSSKNEELGREIEARRRLGDVKAARDLVAAADRLWPAEPSRAAELAAWLERADDLVDAAGLHRADLARLTAEADPYTDGQRRLDHEATYQRIGEVERQLELLEDSDDRSAPRQIEELETELARLEEDVAVRKTWTFDGGRDADRALRHTLLRELVGLLDGLTVAGTGTIADVRRRLAWAESVHARTITDHAAAWARAAEELETDSRFAGVALAPQVGLVPLGEDPGSGLQEFLHLQTHQGPLPKRADDGILATGADTGLVFVLVPGGAFWMGSSPPSEGLPNPDEGCVPEREFPPVRVTLDAFFISKAEMSRAQWERFTRETLAPLPGQADAAPETPVETVSWYRAQTVLHRLGLLLPTEAQWEYATRAGTETPWWTGAERESARGAVNIADRSAARSGRTWPAIAHWPELDDGVPLTAPVFSMRANPWGLHHVIGNVQEWCRDRYMTYRAPAAPKDGERTAVAAPSRVVRGGSFYGTIAVGRSASRSHELPEGRNFLIGVRPSRAIR